MFDPKQEDLVVGVVGAGAMGQGIVQVALQGGMRVVLFDARDGGAEAGLKAVFGRLERSVEKGRITQEAYDGMRSSASVADGWSSFSDAHVIVEAVFEDLEVKHSVFKNLEAVVSPDCILTSNTSSLPIASIARVLDRPERVAGLHFFNPVPLMRLVEVIKGAATSDEVMDALMVVGERMGRTPVKVKDAPGFLVNLGGRAFTTEGLHLVHEGVATPAQVDAVMKDCGHFRMGPFELMDLTGIDVNYPVSLIVHEQYNYDPRLRTAPLHKALFDAGWFGRKTRQGHYRYDDKGTMIDPPSPDHVTDAAPAKAVYVAADADVFGEVLAGASRLASDDGESPIVAALFGEDASAFAARTGLDYRRIVAVDTTGDVSKRLTVMTAPGADPAARDAVAALFVANGKAVTAIKDSPGFICQRMRSMIGNLGCEMAQIGIADPASIDLAMRLGLNYRMGPIETVDDMGTELTHRIMQAMYEASGDSRYRPSQWLRRRAQLGLLASVPA